jgi:DNA polymerase III sliding clamp (beta) subunit (PCNA family)
MLVKRSELLQNLESVMPGLSPRDIVEQSSCFIFKDGEVITFNDEVACRKKIDLKITGAVTAQKLVEVLRRLVEDELEVNVEDGELVLTGKRRMSGINMDKEILLDIDKIEKPSKWKKLHEDFTDAVHITVQCASKDESTFSVTCVHLHPKFIEACDNFKMARYKIATGFANRALVRSSSLRHITQLGMTEFSETETWLHFRNQTGVVLSIRRYADVDEFPDLSSFLKIKGVPTTLPKGLGEAVSRANIFSSEKGEDENQISVELKPGKVRIKGEGSSGWYSEVKNIKYEGEPMKFMIGPDLLSELLKRHNECEINPEALKVDAGKFVYVTSLEQPENSNGSDDKEEDD